MVDLSNAHRRWKGKNETWLGFLTILALTWSKIGFDICINTQNPLEFDDNHFEYGFLGRYLNRKGARGKMRREKNLKISKNFQNFDFSNLTKMKHPIV